MTLEEFFIKDYQEIKKKLNELEKNKKLVEIELKEKQSILKEVVDLLKEASPYITENGFIYLSYLSSEAKVKELLKKLGIETKEQNNE